MRSLKLIHYLATATLIVTSLTGCESRVWADVNVKVLYCTSPDIAEKLNRIIAEKMESGLRDKTFDWDGLISIGQNACTSHGNANFAGEFRCADAILQAACKK